MGTIADKLEYLSVTKDAIKTAVEGKGVSVPDGTTFRGYAALIASMPSGGIYQEKTAIPTGEQFDVLPDAGYDALSKVTVAGDSALKPWNIPKGTTIYGVVGTAKLAVTTDPPADLPVSKGDADAALAENDATADASAYDLMVLAQDDGNITYCYLAKDTQNSPFTITSYDPITTEFKAKGWRRLSYHTTGEQAGTWTYDDFTDTESGGWNYLKNIRSCSRDKLYYNGVEVWPNNLYTWQTVYTGTVTTSIQDTLYPIASIPCEIFSNADLGKTFRGTINSSQYEANCGISSTEDKRYFAEFSHAGSLFAIQTHPGSGVSYVVTQNPGIYEIKIEKKVTE